VAELPWRSSAEPTLESEYLALVTYLPLNTFRGLPQFLIHTARIQKLLRASPGLVGYSLLAQVLAQRFWTLSVWQDEAVLMHFVRAEAHRKAMTSLSGLMGATEFRRWRIQGVAMPPTWHQAMERLPENARA
jgi:heme-degrading monooxygenase HmoA